MFIGNSALKEIHLFLSQRDSKKFAIFLLIDSVLLITMLIIKLTKVVVRIAG